MTEFVTWINEEEHRLERMDPETTLLQYLRSVGLTGTKLGCGEGGCGACTVVIGSYKVASQKYKYVAANACLLPLAACHERHILTVEGIGTVSRPHLVQAAMAADASQCGFCTPGFVMSLYAAWRNGELRAERVEETLDGNLCRCTGYRPIVDAARRVCALGTACCRNQPNSSMVEGLSSKGTTMGTVESRSRDPSQEIIFPPRLKLHLEANPPTAIDFSSSRLIWHRPVTLRKVLELKEKYPDAKILLGNTEIGVEVKLKNQHFPVLIYGGDIAELDFIREEGAIGIEFGAGLCLNDLKRYCEAHMKEPRSAGLGALYEMLRWFAGNQIRNVATWAGNLATASPISDLNPVWAALGAIVVLISATGGERSLPVSDFFLGYRETALRPVEVIKSIILPWTRPREYCAAYKQSKRRDDDIAIVNSAFRVLLNEHGQVVECAIVYGGMGPTTLVSRKASQWMVGKCFTGPGLLDAFFPVLQAEFHLPSDAVGGMPEYRNALVPSLFYKFYLQTCTALGLDLESSLRTAVQPRHTEPSQSSQYYSLRCDEHVVVGQPVPHLSALKHSTGNAHYVDDMPPFVGELYAGLLLSTKAHATIKAIDAAGALQEPGVKGIVFHTDVPTNVIGPVVADERVFVEDRVTACGQIIGIVLATDQRTAQRAAKMVKIDYQDLPAILTINVPLEPVSTSSHSYVGGHPGQFLLSAP